MSEARYRILLDLSLAPLGYSGIPQETRMLFKMLSESPQTEVTGLVYSHAGGGMNYKFLDQGLRGDQLLEQSLFMGELFNRAQKERFSWIKTYFNMARQSIFHSRKYFHQLDTEFFWDPIWRNLFQKTLAPADLPLIKNGRFLLSNLTHHEINFRARFGIRPPFLDTSGYDFFITQDAKSIQVHPDTIKIARYHDLIPVIRPDLVGNSESYSQNHHKNIKRCLRDTRFVCNSDPTRLDLTRAYPPLENRTSIIPVAISPIFRPDRDSMRLKDIFRRRISNRIAEHSVQNGGGADIPYLISVSTIEPRKNFIGLIEASHLLRMRRTKPFRIVVVGSLGWKYEETLKHFKTAMEDGLVVHMENVPPDELRILYSFAKAHISCSYYEGFGMPGVEALNCGTASLLSDIPAHRWVMGDTAVYFDPYDMESIARCMDDALFREGSDSERGELLKKVRKRAGELSWNESTNKWLALFKALNHDGEPKIPVASRDEYTRPACLTP